MKYILFIMGLLCSYVSMAIEPVKEGNVIAGHVIAEFNLQMQQNSD